ncbi:MAG: serine hydrolase domain-containing protein [Ferrimicrobium sp.]|uniref:Serine hydrolase domain-containing protein n=1 Tax=Ferrimicrobium acidiphilum TaxID=121039 RepID=A0ABV3XYA1_9ACTN
MGRMPEDRLEPGESLAYGRITDLGVEVGACVGSEERRPWASVSKLVASLGVHIAIEDGSWLRQSTLGDFALAVEELLSHCSGLATGALGEKRLAEPEHVEPSLARRSRRVYSNIGYELLGRGLESISSMRYRDYILEAVLAPAGMTGVRFARDLEVTGAAFGLEGTLDDLVGLVRALSFPSIVSSESLTALRAPFLPGIAGILPGFGYQDPNPWGLGAEVRGRKSPHWMGDLVSEASFGHFGQSGSFLWIDPIQQCFAVFLGSRPFGPWAKERWPMINDEVVRALAS